MAHDLRPSSRGGRAAWRWCRVYSLLAPAPTRARHQEEILAHLLDAEAAGVPGWRLAVEAALGAGDAVRLVDATRRRHGHLPLVVAPVGRIENAVGVAAALVAMSYAASVFAAFPVPRQIKFASMRAAAAVLGVALVLRLHDRWAKRRLDGRALSSYKEWWARNVRAKGGPAMSATQRRIFIGLGITLVVTFLLSSVGQDKTPSDGGLYWVGALAWAAFGVTALASLALAVVALMTRRRRSEA